ncbi:uncharacterized protein BCR38DRAFT_160135 [Pseudomassariella vexata]|uniref:Uncharacterized protein n=1 Tax=Pseudomassariella vexata TaxID=1141098 RepID=A0A1Y2E7Q6_9PEZI|nr:uncharacterized protein BCR38DRAFT_160135 [Pseudomassariella vexata]ORY67570.1 hypothetical protein BCR38DRAFT_160135 [Pseudomassariella vexata]
MDLIYTYAKVTIIAAVGLDSSYGLSGAGERCTRIALINSGWSQTVDPRVCLAKSESASRLAGCFPRDTK